MFDVISGKVIFEFNNVYIGDFHPYQLVLSTVSFKKSKTRRGSSFILQVWDLHTFTIISQLEFLNTPLPKFLIISSI